MNGDVETEAPRPRPLSGGLWTLFSWLRRDEHSSSESLSSVGSDRTAASFAFLPPARYATASPVVLPPPGPPTDSYKKRVRDRNLRRQNERDLTLHRKYGLYGLYDAFSLPNARRSSGFPLDRCERDRRAASECVQRRAHVPGKRRAPLPPTANTTLPRRRARKRPAPLPPALTQIKEQIDDNSNIVQMNQQSPRDKQSPKNSDNTMECKPEKCSKKDAQAKDVKIRREKSFLKHIFDNKKRNSAIETSSVKLLPNISELDKQAAELIEKYRLKELAQNDRPDNQKDESPGSSKQQMEAWICTRCLRKYNASVITCMYCLPINRISDSSKSSKLSNSCTQTKTNNVTSVSSSGKIEDKEKLKEMLKEMKDSLPKRPKSYLSSQNKAENINNEITKEDFPKTVEAPTLRIGSIITREDSNDPVAQTSSASHNRSEKEITNKVTLENKNQLTTIESVLITQPVVLVHTKANVVVNKSNASKQETAKIIPIKIEQAKSLIADRNKNRPQIECGKSNNESKSSNVATNTNNDLNTPLKISTLLNPIYVPKITTSTQLPNIVPQTQDVKEVEISSTTTPANTQNDVNMTVPSIPQTKLTTSITSHKDANDEQKKEPQKKMGNKEQISSDNLPQVKIDDKKPEVKPEIKVNNIFTTTTSASIPGPSASKEHRKDQHSRRRDLINQLEKSIAKGDEQAAADAAVKLAQLRLSCSVLSFSSQIISEPSTSSPNAPQQITASRSVSETKIKKVEEVTQKSSQINTVPVKPEAAQASTENILGNKNMKDENKEKQSITNKAGVNVPTKTPPKSASPKSVLENKTNSENKDAISQKSLPCETSTSKGVNNENEDVPILIWVEDKETTRGPVQLHVRRNSVMGDLRRQAEKSLGLAAYMQRWIVGRTLCSDDNTPLITLAGPELTAPFYLCLVESDTKKTEKPPDDIKVNDDTGNVYNELVKLEKQALVTNAEVFECEVCIEECAIGSGVVLRECVHSFCKKCLSDVVSHSEEPVVACPAMGCRGFLQEREIRALVSPEDYEKWLARGLTAAESGTRNAFHCRTRDCTGWALCDPGVQRFPCPVCKRTNCVPCQAIHEGESCEQHRAKLQESSSADASQTDEGTRALLSTLISRGEALECPECSAIITKKWGCDWVKCSACKTEICWVTKGKRWGPAGRGDTSGGCRCGVDGKRCHPSCGYCH